MDFQLTDRVVVITGAGSGIGLATAKLFVKEGPYIVNIPPGDIGSLQFGIIYIQENGTAFFRNVNGQVTSNPAVAIVPEGFGYIASITPIISGAASSHRTVVITSK